MLFIGDILQYWITGVFKTVQQVDCQCIALVNIWKETIVYDELTINERQKKNELFVDILYQVRRGSPLPESLECLKMRVINVPVVDKYVELNKVGPTRKACREINDKMLSALDTEVHKIVCIDEIDETQVDQKGPKATGKT